MTRRAALATLVLAAAVGSCRPRPAPPQENPDVSTAPDTSFAPVIETAPDASAIPDTLPPVVVVEPRAGAQVGDVVRVAGSANVFEAHVGLVVRDAGGRVVVDTFAMATCGTGCRGTWAIVVPLGGAPRGALAIEAFAPSGEDGRPLHVVRVPIVRP